MYDYSKLLGKMREKGFTQNKLSKKIGLSESSLNFSLNNKRDFRQSEITKICDELNISYIDIERYFFAHQL